MEADVKLDCYGLLCPMPVIETSQKIKELRIGQVLEIIATDEGAKTDIPAWSKMVGQEFLGFEQSGDELRLFVKKVKEVN